MNDDSFKHEPEYVRTLVAKFQGGEVWIADGQFVVLGVPLSCADDDSEDAHNCDALGCGTDHVVFREVIPTAKEMGALYDHFVTCEQSPLVREVAALRSLLARAHGAITRCERTSQGREAAKVLDDIDAALAKSEAALHSSPLGEKERT